AGYINYISNIDDKTKEVNAGIDGSGEIVDIYSTDIDPDDLSLLEPGTAVMTSSGVSNSAVISEVKINREQIRAANKETLYQIIDNEALDAVSKQAAVNEMIKMTDISEKEMAAELLLSARGYGDCVVTIVDDSVDVVVNTTELTDVQRAQIEDIVKRKTDCAADKIVISPINNLQ
ncbi:MAG: SpoIIIAH-like family protein, partial [Alistipes sp.]|nr:SpoIIIAH-like family protein [Alistipes sp.]